MERNASQLLKLAIASMISEEAGRFDTTRRLAHRPSATELPDAVAIINSAFRDSNLGDVKARLQRLTETSATPSNMACGNQAWQMAALTPHHQARAAAHGADKGHVALLAQTESGDVSRLLPRGLLDEDPDIDVDQHHGCGDDLDAASSTGSAAAEYCPSEAAAEYDLAGLLGRTCEVQNEDNGDVGDAEEEAVGTGTAAGEWDRGCSGGGQEQDTGGSQATDAEFQQPQYCISICARERFPGGPVRHDYPDPSDVPEPSTDVHAGWAREWVVARPAGQAGGIVTSYMARAVFQFPGMPHADVECMRYCLDVATGKTIGKGGSNMAALLVAAGLDRSAVNVCMGPSEVLDLGDGETRLVKLVSFTCSADGCDGDGDGGEACAEQLQVAEGQVMQRLASEMAYAALKNFPEGRAGPCAPLMPDGKRACCVQIIVR